MEWYSIGGGGESSSGLRREAGLGALELAGQTGVGEVFAAGGGESSAALQST